MRKLMLICTLIALVYASCESTETKSTAVGTESPAGNAIVTDQHLYSCPMHSHITGNKGDKCSNCGMDMTETTKREDGTMDGGSMMFACSMHPEVTGKKGEKCSKCGMALTEAVKK